MGLFGKLGGLFGRRKRAERAPQPARREDLLEAHARLTRQIEVLAAGPVNARDATPMSGVLAAELGAALAEVDEALAQLETDEADEAGLGAAAGDWEYPDDDEAAELFDPAVLAAFEGVVTNVARNAGGLWVEYRITCPRCLGGDMFALTAVQETIPSPSPYDGYQPGDVARFPPYVARCVQCKTSAVLFDSNVSGHDSALNPVAEDPDAPEEPVATFAAGTVSVFLRYDAPLDKLRAEAAKAGVAPGDLFDLIHIRSVTPSGREILSDQYGCKAAS